MKSVYVMKNWKTRRGTERLHQAFHYHSDVKFTILWKFRSLFWNTTQTNYMWWWCTLAQDGVFFNFLLQSFVLRCSLRQFDTLILNILSIIQKSRKNGGRSAIEIFILSGFGVFIITIALPSYSWVIQIFIKVLSCVLAQFWYANNLHVASSLHTIAFVLAEFHCFSRCDTGRSLQEL